MLTLGESPNSVVLAQGVSTPAIRLEIPSSFNPVGSGARALGMGGAFVSIADDATAASWNPAGLIQLRHPEIAVVGSYFYRNEDNSFGTNPEASGDEGVSNHTLNYFSASYPCKAAYCGRNMVFSLNYQNLFNFDRKWNFRLQQSARELTSDERIDYRQKGDLYAIGLAYAVQATEQLSLGVTFNFWRDFLYDNEWTQRYRVFQTGILGSTPFTTREFSKDKFSFRGFNLNLGLWWEAYQREEKKLTIGMALKTPFTADITHKFRLHRTSTLDPFFSTAIKEKQKLRMPLVFSVGTSYQFSDNFTLAIDVARTSWDDFELKGTDGSNRSPISNLPSDESDVDATYQVRIGGEYRIISKELNSAMFWLAEHHAASCSCGQRSKSVLSRMNFWMSCSWEVSRRNSGNVLRSACATTASEGGWDGFIVRSQLRKHAQTSARKDSARYCNNPCAMQPSCT